MSKLTRFLSKEEAANFLGVSVRSIERLIEKKEIAFYKYGDNPQSKVRLSESDLIKWAAKFRTEAQTA